MNHLPYMYSFCLNYGIRHIQNLFCDGVLSTAILLHHTTQYYAIVLNIVTQPGTTLYGIVLRWAESFLRFHGIGFVASWSGRGVVTPPILTKPLVSSW